MQSKKQPHKRVQPTFKKPSLAQQQFKDDSNINTITNRYIKNRIPMPGHNNQPLYGDFTSLDFQIMLNAILDVKNNFGKLPARVRSRFENDPYQVIRFCEDPNNYDEAVKIGLIPPKEAPQEPLEKRIAKEVVTQQDLVKQAEKGVK